MSGQLLGQQILEKDRRTLKFLSLDNTLAEDWELLGLDGEMEGNLDKE